MLKSSFWTVKEEATWLQGSAEFAIKSLTDTGISNCPFS